LSQVVGKASTTTSLTSSANPSVVGQTVTYTATAAPVAPGSGTPTGTMEFFSGATPITGCTAVAVNGSSTATCAVTYTGPATNSITATYSGDANFSTSTSSALSQVINKASTTTSLSSSVNPS